MQFLTTMSLVVGVVALLASWFIAIQLIKSERFGDRRHGGSMSDANQTRAGSDASRVGSTVSAS